MYQKIKVTGTIVTYPEIISEKNGHSLLRMYIAVVRASKIVDRLPVTFTSNSDVCKLLSDIEKSNQDIVGLSVLITGEVVSYDSYVASDHRLNIYVLAHRIKQIDKRDVDINEVRLKGIIAKLLEPRVILNGGTLLSGITAIYSSKKSRYVPTLFWNKVAKRVNESLKVGDSVSLIGRLQAREYIKRIGTDAEGRDITENRTVYEVSVFGMKNE